MMRSITAPLWCRKSSAPPTTFASGVHDHERPVGREAFDEVIDAVVAGVDRLGQLCTDQVEGGPDVGRTPHVRTSIAVAPLVFSGPSPRRQRTSASAPRRLKVSAVSERSQPSTASG